MKIKDAADAQALRTVAPQTGRAEGAAAASQAGAAQQAGAAKAAAQAASSMEAPASRKALTLETAKAAAGAQRAARLEALKAQVQGGTYKPDAGAIADRIMQSAELDARLRLALQKP